MVILFDEEIKKKEKKYGEVKTKIHRKINENGNKKNQINYGKNHHITIYKVMNNTKW